MEKKKSKKFPKISWNYRVGTQILEVPKESRSSAPDYRIFSVVEVYYRNGKAESWGKTNVLSSWEAMKGLKASHRLAKKAFDKPIIDLDNFPEEYKGKHKK